MGIFLNKILTVTSAAEFQTENSHIEREQNASFLFKLLLILDRRILF